MELTTIRRNGALAMVGIACACIAVIAAMSLSTGHGLWPIIVGIGSIGVPAIAVLRNRVDAATRIMLGMALPVMPAIMLYLAAGSTLQIDIHMLFFALLAATVVMCDWRAIVAGTLVIALHHLGANVLMPAWVFPDGADLGRVILHAVIVLVEAGVLVFISQRLEHMVYSQAKIQAEADRLEREVQISRDSIAAEQALVIGALGKGLNAMSRGDMTLRIDVDFPPSYAQLKTDFEAAADGMQQSLSKISHAANTIDISAQHINEGAGDLARRTEHQAANLQATAAATHRIAETVNESSHRASRAQDVLTAATQEAQASAEIVSRARAAMSNISRSATEIDQIIAVIDGLSFQTNLLALNAGVEAARVGEAGKGFAVVAAEVRALAQRSAEAATDIKSRISTSNEQIAVGVEVVTETSETLDRITGRIIEISDFVSTIASSVEEQASGLRAVNAAMGTLDGITQQNAAMVEETSAAARTLAAESHVLAQEVARFRLADATDRHDSYAAMGRIQTSHPGFSRAA